MRRTSKVYGQNPRAFGRERLDCAVRALRCATGTSYEEAHAALKAEGRPDRSRTPWGVQDRAYHRLGFARYMLDIEHERLTLTQFIARFRRDRGAFLLSTRSHTFAIVDGVVHDWSRGAGTRSRIVRIYTRHRI